MSEESASAGDMLPVAQELLIDEICNAFEAGCKQGDAPDIEAYVSRATPPLRSRLRRELIAIQSHYNRHRDDVRQFNGQPSGSCSTARANADTSAPSQRQPVDVNRLVGDYELLAEIARGGMGVVYKARQISLNRYVALKLILSGEFASRQEMERFQVEAEAAAALDHLHIVPVYEFGEHEGQKFLAMKLIEGGSLATRKGDFALACRSRNGEQASSSQSSSAEDPTARQRCIASLLSKVARAVHYAHQHGILHRDLKPSNILLDGNGNPLVSDFGLAKRVDVLSPLTGSSAMLGTPAYMAPETISHGDRKVSTSVDIYALGVILYELLAGRTPFQHAEPLEMLNRTIGSEPPLPRSEQPHVSVDLQTICLKCLRKDPLARYATAAELADDLDRYQRGEPISARPTTALAKTWMWCRRKPAAALTIGLVVGLVVLMAAISVFAAIRLRSERDATRMALRKSLTTQARFLRQSGQAGQRYDALAALAEAAAIQPDQELRDEAITCMTLPDLRVAASWPTVRPHTFVGSIAFDPMLGYYACPGTQSLSIGQVPRESADKPRIVSDLEGLEGYPSAARFSPDSQLVAVRWETPQGDRLQVWKWRENKRIVQVDDAVTERAFDFHPDGRRLFVAVQIDEQWRMATYDLGSGERTLGVTIPSKPYELRCDPTGRYVAVSSPKAECVSVLDAASGEVVHVMNFYEDIYALAWRPDGEILAVSRGFQVDLRDLSKPGYPSSVLTGHRWMISELMFDATGELLASHSMREGETRVWDVRSRETLIVTPGHAAGFGPHGRRLAFRRGATLGVWELTRGVEYRRLLGRDPKRTTGFRSTFLARGRLLADGGSGGLRLWDLAGPDEVLRLEVGMTGAVRSDPASGGLFVGGERGLRLWAIESLSDGHFAFGPPENLGVPAGSFVADVDCSADGSLVAAVLRDEGRIWLSDRRRDETRFIPCDPRLGYVAVSPDGQWIAGGCLEHPRFFVWNAHTHETVWQSEEGHTAGPVRFSPDGCRLIACASDRYSLYSIGDWQKVWVRRRPAGAPGVAAFTGDSDVVAIAESHDRLALIDVETGHEIALLNAGFDPGAVFHLEFSPGDGLLIASCSSGGLRLWNLRKIRTGLRELKLDWDGATPSLPSWKENAPPLEIQVRRTSEPQTEVGAKAIALEEWANQRLDDDLRTGQPGNDNLGSLPRGLLVAAGTQFRIDDKLIQLGSPQLPHHPSAVNGVCVGEPFRRLHILHGVVHPTGVPLGAVVARYIVHYENGQTAQIPVRYGLDVWDFWATDSQLRHLHLETRPNPSLRTAWVGGNPAASANAKQLRLYLMCWPNPHPDMLVTQIDLMAANPTIASLFCVALTVER